MKEPPLVDKVAQKHNDGSCVICDNKDYDVLNLHRIIPGADGGRYTAWNVITVCANCHNRIHAGQIVIDRKYPSTSGRPVLHFWEGEQEFWK